MSSKNRPEPLAPAPRPHPEQVFALSALGWRVVGVRPVVGAGGAARYSVTIARRDGAVSMAITHAAPCDVVLMSDANDAGDAGVGLRAA